MGIKIKNVALPTNNVAQPIGEGFNPLVFNDNPNHDEMGRFTGAGGGGSIRQPHKGLAKGRTDVTKGGKRSFAGYDKKPNMGVDERAGDGDRVTTEADLKSRGS